MARKLLRYPSRTGKYAVLYIRVSKGEKVQQSLPGQVTIALRAMKLQGYELATWVGEAYGAAAGGVFKDERSRGVRRDGLHGLLQAMEDHPSIGAAFFWDYRRVWGHQEQYRRINARAVKAGYRLVDGQGTDHTSETAMETFIAQTRSNISELEIGTVGERAKEQNTEKLLKGQVVTRLPLGGRTEYYLEKDGKRRSRHFIDPHDIAIARRIFTMYRDGKNSHVICETLVEEGVRTSRDIEKGRPATWKPDALRNLIDNRWYIGKMDYNRTGTEWELDEVTGDKIRRVRARHPDEFMEGPSPLGVTLAEDPSDPVQVEAAIRLWNECQAWRDKRGRERPEKQYEGVLESLVQCGRCRKLMTRARMSYRTRSGEWLLNFNWACPYRSNIGTGCKKSHSMSENKIFAGLAELFKDPGVADRPVEWRQSAPDQGAIKRALRLAEGTVGEKEGALQRVHQAWESGAYDSAEEYKERKAAVRQEIEEAKADVEVARARLSAIDVRQPLVSASMVTAWADFVDLLRDEALPLAKRQEEARRQIERIEIDHPRMRVWLRSPPSTAGV